MTGLKIIAAVVGGFVVGGVLGFIPYSVEMDSYRSDALTRALAEVRAHPQQFEANATTQTTTRTTATATTTTTSTTTLPQPTNTVHRPNRARHRGGPQTPATKYASSVESDITSEYPEAESASCQPDGFDFLSCAILVGPTPSNPYGSHHIYVRIQVSADGSWQPIGPG